MAQRWYHPQRCRQCELRWLSLCRRLPGRAARPRRLRHSHPCLVPNSTHQPQRLQWRSCQSAMHLPQMCRSTRRAQRLMTPAAWRTCPRPRRPRAQCLAAAPASHRPQSTRTTPRVVLHRQLWVQPSRRSPRERRTHRWSRKGWPPGLGPPPRPAAPHTARSGRSGPRRPAARGRRCRRAQSPQRLRVRARLRRDPRPPWRAAHGP
mmetsp:Transcript_83153/g.231377  ORF Transcript_83153/g.231377 Transcript_83153/m.231377 type:complete len:206 (-) Transcript_83153:559-1176(-)